jgi:glycosyltransferase involved in cell wall biosynthesis
MLAPMTPAAQPRVALDAALLREPYSGVEVLIHETACALARHGTLPYVVYTPAVGTRPLPAFDRMQVRAVAPNQPRLRRILWEQFVLPRLAARDGAQVLHAPAYVAPVAARMPVVLTIHDLHVFTHPQFCTPANRLHYRLLLPLSIRRAAAIVVCSDHVRRIVAQRFPAAAAKIHLIPPGLPSSAAAIVDRDPRPAAAATEGAPVLPARFLLFVGDLAPRKNLPGVLAAFARIRNEYPDMNLLVAGAGRAGPAADGVRWLGYVPPADLPSLYARAEALVFPSFDEGFGLPALEAMAAGCPVVCTPGGAAEVCGEAAQPCDPRDPASIAAAVRALLADPARRAACVAAGRRRAAQFQWEDTVRQLEDLYRSLLAV